MIFSYDMNAEEKLKLIKRNTEEIITEKELKELLTKRRNLLFTGELLLLENPI